VPTFAGWRIEATPAALRHAAAAVVNGDPIGVYQDAGDPGWQAAANVPPNLRIVSDLSSLREVADRVGPTRGHRFPTGSESSLAEGVPEASEAEAGFAALLVISDRVIDLPGPPDCTVMYRPPTLVAGVGCSRGATVDDIATAVELALAQGGLAQASLARLATLDRRLDEPGVVEFAQRSGLALAGYAAELLAGVAAVPNPSAVVQAAVGTPGVCEPAALLASGARALLVPKIKTARATAAIARIDAGAASE